jgi:hypothetical protein
LAGDIDSTCDYRGSYSIDKRKATARIETVLALSGRETGRRETNNEDGNKVVRFGNRQKLEQRRQ